MTDIEIVVKIPKKFYEKVKYGRSANNLINNAIANGTPSNKVIDKIRAEMFEEMLSHSGTGDEVIQAYADGLKKGLDIIDKYKGESEKWLR